MLAHALLGVLAAVEDAAAAPPAGLIPLTCNELQRLLLRRVIEPAAGRPIPKPGPDGGDDTTTAPGRATTTRRQAAHDQDIYGWSGAEVARLTAHVSRRKFATAFDWIRAPNVDNR